MTPLIEIRKVSKYFGPVEALKDISMKVYAGEIHCLLGDNGAGKSTLIKIISGVYRPSSGQIFIEGQRKIFNSPRAAMNTGIATVYQDLAMLPLLSISRNFFLGREPKRKFGPFKIYDATYASEVASKELHKIGISIRDPNQPVGTLSGGERQSVAIARAVHFGAKILILDEPTSALGVKEAAVVLKYIVQAKARGLGVILITHNVHHAWAVGETFTILNRGHSYGTFKKGETTHHDILNMMAGGEELEELAIELDEFAKKEKGTIGKMEHVIAEELHKETE